MQKITMIELFSGIGAQIRGIEQTKCFDCEVIGTSEIDKDALVSYACIHKNLTIDMINTYDNYPSVEEMVNELKTLRIGYDFVKDKEYDWNRVGNKKDKYELKKYWLANHLCKNYGDISLIKELPYTDVLTYSFCCQDISVSGKMKGIKKGTRSGLLYEVERLLDIAKEKDTLPKFLLLENVKNLVSEKFKPDFDEWNEKLDAIGYNTYYQVLNAKDAGCPQARERIFAISIRKDIDTDRFTFPIPFDNGLRTKDLLLEEPLDDKYYLSDIMLTKGYIDFNKVNSEKVNIIRHSGTGGQKGAIYSTEGFLSTLCASDYKQPKQIVDTNKLIQVYNLSGGKWDNIHELCRRVYSSDGIIPTLHTCQGGNHEAKMYIQQKIFRKLTPVEYYLGMGFTIEDTNKVQAIGMSDSQMYKQAGNSIVTNCIQLLFEHIYKAQYDYTYITTDERMNMNV